MAWADGLGGLRGPELFFKKYLSVNGKSSKREIVTTKTTAMLGQQDHCFFRDK